MQTESKPSVALLCAECLRDFVTTTFDPKNDRHWEIVDKLNQAAMLTRELKV